MADWMKQNIILRTVADS